MNYLVEGFKQAGQLLISGEGGIYEIVALSLFVSVLATAFSAAVALPLACLLGQSRFRKHKWPEVLLYNAMSMPTVVIGLLVFLFLSRKGPFGFLSLLYTPGSMMIAQFFLTFPIILGLGYQTVSNHADRTLELAYTLGSSRLRTIPLLLREYRNSFIVCTMTAFSRAISEVGAVMIVGGNIKGHTRVMTTAISLNNSMGEYGTAIALAIILLIISLIVNSLIYLIPGRTGEKS